MRIRKTGGRVQGHHLPLARRPSTGFEIARAARLLIARLIGERWLSAQS
jgi:hypothetical protein